MNLENIMSKDMIVVNYNTSLKETATLMKQYDIGFVPIHQGSKIVGVITDRDIVVSATANGAHFDDTVLKYMTKNPISIDKTKSLEDALSLMGEKKVKRLLVTYQKKLVGIVSLSDLIHTEMDDKKIVDNLKKIWEIYKNIDTYDTEIDAFYL